jgi:hypothetical protein
VAGGSGSAVAAVTFALLESLRRPAPPPAVAPVAHAVLEEPACSCAACPAPPTCPVCLAAAEGLVAAVRRALRALADLDDGAIWAVVAAASAWATRRLAFLPRRAAALERLGQYP